MHQDDTTLQIEVEGSQIIVTMLGTSFRTTYSIVAEAPTLMQCQAMAHDSNAGISRREFETAAWGAANHKARELGWIT